MTRSVDGDSRTPKKYAKWVPVALAATGLTALTAACGPVTGGSKAESSPTKTPATAPATPTPHPETSSPSAFGCTLPKDYVPFGDIVHNRPDATHVGPIATVVPNPKKDAHPGWKAPWTGINGFPDGNYYNLDLTVDGKVGRGSGAISETTKVIKMLRNSENPVLLEGKQADSSGGGTVIVFTSAKKC